MLRPLWIAAAIALVAPGAHAEVSSWCLWTQLDDLHAVATRCAGQLSPEVEARYEGFRKTIEAAILRDAPLRAGASAESAKAEMTQYAAKRRAIHPARCESPDLKSAVGYFETLTSPENVAKLEAGLAKRRDPYEGDCL
jgi:hypothetical protein